LIDKTTKRNGFKATFPYQKRDKVETEKIGGNGFKRSKTAKIRYKIKANWD